MYENGKVYDNGENFFLKFALETLNRSFISNFLIVQLQKLGSVQTKYFKICGCFLLFRKYKMGEI